MPWISSRVTSTVFLYETLPNHQSMSKLKKVVIWPQLSPVSVSLHFKQFYGFFPLIYASRIHQGKWQAGLYFPVGFGDYRPAHHGAHCITWSLRAFFQRSSGTKSVNFPWSLARCVWFSLSLYKDWQSSTFTCFASRPHPRESRRLSVLKRAELMLLSTLRKAPDRVSCVVGLSYHRAGCV